MRIITPTTIEQAAWEGYLEPLNEAKAFASGEEALVRVTLGEPVWWPAAEAMKSETSKEWTLPAGDRAYTLVRKAVLDAVWRWSGGSRGEGQGARGGSRVLITTRDTAFNDARFAPSRACAHVALEGLAQVDALALAAAVLDDHGIDRTGIPRQALVDLMAHLGGHPLSLYLVLPYLRDHTPDQLITDFEKLLPGFTAGAATERNESLAVSLDFSLRRLGDETRAALPDLAVFQGGAMENVLLAITKIDPDLWAAARAELEQAALLRTENVPGVTVPFLRFHPTLVPYLATRLADERRAELEERYWREYYATAISLYSMDTKNPHQARAIAQRELPNLRRALDLALAAGAIDEAVGFADSIARFLDYFGRWRERDAMMEKVASGMGQGARGEGLTKAEFLLESQQGERLLQQGRAAEAEQIFQALLAKLEASAAYDTAYDQAMTFARLGRCLKAQGQPSQAIKWHRRALAGFERLSGTSEQAKKMAAACHVDWADNLTNIGKFEEAQQRYEAALPVLREIDDKRSVGVVLGQLGKLALRRGDLAEAGKRYREALDTFRTLGEPQSEAVIWHQLGMVAEKGKDWDEAERCYREAVRIREQIRDLPELAKSYNQLATVAKGAGRPDEAERWYLRAQALKDEISPQDASTLNNLANLTLSQGRLDEAEAYARRALAIKETLDLSAAPWTTYQILAEIAAARGRVEEARAWRRKEQESYAAYAGAAHAVREWMPIIQLVVAACEGDAQSVEKVDSVLQQYENGWPTTVVAIRKILDGERGIEILRIELPRKAFVVINTILMRLSGEAAPDPGAAHGSADQDRPSDAKLAATIEQVRQEFAPVIQMAAAAAGGDPQAGEQMAALLTQLDADDNWQALAAALRRILEGERNPNALLPGLDVTDSIVIAEILRVLLSPASASKSEAEQTGITLDQLIEMVGGATSPDAPAGMAAQLHAATRQLANEPNAPAEFQALGRALNAILAGDRTPDLAGLSPEMAAKVRAMLAGL